jgi:hypothetical protein
MSFIKLKELFNSSLQVNISFFKATPLLKRLNLELAKTKKEVPEEALDKKLWRTADKLRKNMDAAEYNHVVLGLIFVKIYFGCL